ncbi:hypothetical protein QR680_007613 [Steinernema hermaphroditum]|uniref:Uncharacterized protein n=1 Tax=Steinernema hermaphroditum TaxID=289476 RepID=A0AA39IF45_9BILA|nr:hypothetical protein QR680_007613 [Steinernema hermaphroditum]
MVSIIAFSAIFLFSVTIEALNGDKTLEAYIGKEVKGKLPSFSACGDKIDFENYCFFEILSGICNHNSNCVAFVQDEITFSTEKTVEELDNVVREAVERFFASLEDK